MQQAVQIFEATEDIPELNARKGQFVLDDGGPVLCVMHEAPRAGLTPRVAALLRPVGLSSS